MEKETIRVQLDTDTVNKAEEVLKENDLTLNEAVKMLYEQFVLTGQLPFEFRA